jgi:hypothetical protein
MLKFVFLAVFVLGTIAGGSQVLINNMLRATMTVEDSAKLRAVKSRLEQSVRVVSGQVMMPLGEEEDNKHTLPSFFTGLRNSANGVKIVYCPYAERDVLTASSVISMSDVDEYDITTVSVQGVSYVSESIRPPVPGVAAALILPDRASSDVLCSDLSVDANGNYELVGDSAGQGRVYALTFSELRHIHSVGIFKNIAVVDGDENLSEILDDAALRPHEDLFISLRSGDSFSLNNSKIFDNSGYNRKRKIVIASSQPGVAATIAGASGTASLGFSNADVVFRDIEFTGGVDVSVKDSDLELVNVSLRRILGEFSDIRLQDVVSGGPGLSFPVVNLNESLTVITGDFYARNNGANVISTIGGSLSFHDANVEISYVGGAIGLQVQNGKFSSEGTSVLTNGNGNVAFYTDSSSQLYWSNTTWENSGNLGFGFYNLGRATLRDSVIGGNNQVAVGFASLPGSVNYFENSSIGEVGSRFSVGIQDDNSLAISGDINIYADTCTDGSAFESSGSVSGTVTYLDTYATGVNTLSFIPTLEYTTESRSLDINASGGAPVNLVNTNCL